MAVLHDYRCGKCGNENEGWSDDLQLCCGQPMSSFPSKISTPEWGGPRQFIHLRDEPFSSRSELDAYATKEGLELGPSAEKVGGARNEDHLHLGKKYSYSGAPTS